MGLYHRVLNRMSIIIDVLLKKARIGATPVLMVALLFFAIRIMFLNWKDNIMHNGKDNIHNNKYFQEYLALLTGIIIFLSLPIIFGMMKTGVLNLIIIASTGAVFYFINKIYKNWEEIRKKKPYFQFKMWMLVVLPLVALGVSIMNLVTGGFMSLLFADWAKMWS